MRRGRCTRIELGISKDATGYRVQATADQRHAERRFPPTASLPFLREQRALLEASLRAPATAPLIPSPHYETLRALEQEAATLKAALDAVQTAIQAVRRLLPPAH